MPDGGSFRPRASDEQRLMTLALGGAAAFLLVGLVLPLAWLFARAFQDASGGFAGLANFAEYVATPSLAVSAWNSLWTAALTTLLVVPAAFTYAYALTRSRMPGRVISGTCGRPSNTRCS